MILQVSILAIAPQSGHRPPVAVGGHREASGLEPIARLITGEAGEPRVVLRAGRLDEPGRGFCAPAAGFVSDPWPVHARVAGLRGRIFQPGQDGRQREAADRSNYRPGDRGRGFALPTGI